MSNQTAIHKPKFPHFGSNNVRLYYVLTIFLNAYFILPNWVFYFSRFITIPAIGLIDGLSKLVAVLLEVPSGAISDVFGKKQTLIFANLAFAACCLILIDASTFSALLIGNMVMFMGYAFMSGAKEAILYDSLLDIGKTDEYDEVLGKVNTITIVTTILTIFAGGLLYRLNPAGPFWAWLVFSVFAIVTLIFMQEPQAAASEEEQRLRKGYLVTLKTGVRSIFSHSFAKFILPVLFFSMLIKSYEGVIRQNTGAYFGFTGETFGYLMAAISVPALVVSYNFGKIVQKFKEHTEYIFILLYVIGFLLVYLTNNLLFGVCSFVSIYAAQEIARPYIISLVNKKTESRHRATALSTVSLMSEIPYMIIVIFFGVLITVENIGYLYLLFTGAVLAYFAMRFLVRDKYAADGSQVQTPPLPPIGTQN